jgi:peptidyl-prolyl cis-trans isomerase A (cyclophilin A)
LKADAEAAMEKLAAGFEKTESGLRYQFIQEEKKTSCSWKTVSVH